MRLKRKAPPICDATEARIQAGIARDHENQETTDAEFERMRPAAEVLPPKLFEALKRRGRPKADVTKVPVKLRLDAATIEHFKATGPGWQTRMNRFLSVNENVLTLIVENEELVEGMEQMLDFVRRGELRMVFEPVQATITQIERNIGNVKETTRRLREQLVPNDT